MAGDDIVCWKILESIKGKDGIGKIYVTPYMFKPVENSVLDGKRMFKPDPCDDYTLEYMAYRNDIEKQSDVSDIKAISVSKGFIHVYGELDPVFMMHEFRYLDGSIGGSEDSIDEIMAPKIRCDLYPTMVSLSLWKCVIPKGTEYIPGTFERIRQVRSYAARQIRFLHKAAEIISPDISLDSLQRIAAETRERDAKGDSSLVYYTYGRSEDVHVNESTGEKLVYLP